ncbi:sulfite exporter TauE/SafE family protein [Alcaligenaceae bacterium]|nr:sulfite exporter TauE/SafE family protein [Alcaligenaceae bacterium]
MSLWVYAALFLVIATGSYFQTVTGFGLGMIIIGVSSGFDLVSVPFIANVVSIVTLVNSGVALHGKLHHLDRRIIGAVMIGLIPSSIAGVLLLDYLNDGFSRVLQLMLGIVIIYSGVQFAFRPTQLKHTSTRASFMISGLLSGLFGGLFGMAGPPVIFLFYRQPMKLVAVRSMLLLIFAASAAVRTVYVVSQGQQDSHSLSVALMAIPIVAVMTIIGRKYPPPLPAAQLRRLAYSVLVIIGIGLLVSAALG